MIDKVEFIERFVFLYDASIDGMGFITDLYESFTIRGILTLRMLHDKQIIKMTEEQYSNILKKISENNDTIDILVFYELNKIPTLVFFSDDYMEIIDNVYTYKDNYAKRSKYKELETTPLEFNWAKNNPQMKYLRYYICNPQEAPLSSKP